MVDKVDTSAKEYKRVPFSSALLPTKDSDTNCNGRIRQARAGYCELSAGWGTYHKGSGRCRFHGGNNKVKHGLYAKHDMPSLKEAIDKAADDPATYTIDTQLALQQGALNELISRLSNAVDKELTDEDISMLLALSDLVSKTLERKARIESTQQHTMKIESLEPILNGVIETIRRFVPEEKRREDIAQALMHIPMPAGVSFGVPKTNHSTGQTRRRLAEADTAISDASFTEEKI